MRKHILRIAAAAAAAMLAMSMLTGCQSENAEEADWAIRRLSQSEITLRSDDDIAEVEQLVAGLSERERKSLKDLALLEQVKAEYAVLVDEEAARIEALIDTLPALDDIRVASDEVISDAQRAYTYASDDVKEAVSNYDALEAAVNRLEQVKADAWVPCENCGGSGRVLCSKCNGSGSRKVPYTTPNGKTWTVHQDCSTTQSCGTCGGDGGIYVEDGE